MLELFTNTSNTQIPNATCKKIKLWKHSFHEQHSFLDIADIAVIRKDTLPAALAALSCTPVPVLSFHPNRSGSACFF